MKLLFLGDVVGEPGLRAVEEHLPVIRRRRRIDFCIINAENAADGFGLTQPVARRLFAAGADVLTGGNHLWDDESGLEYLAQEARIVRPANAPADLPGAVSAVRATASGVRVGVLNLLGRVFMRPADCPFRTADRRLAMLAADASVIIVDVHAEATSEKIALGWYLDGRVSAVIGTHTHVQTADECVLPRGTAYITDVGMTGPFESVIGVERECAMARFLEGERRSLPTASGDPRLSGVVVEIDEQSGRARGVTRLHMRSEP